MIASSYNLKAMGNLQGAPFHRGLLYVYEFEMESNAQTQMIDIACCVHAGDQKVKISRRE